MAQRHAFYMLLRPLTQCVQRRGFRSRGRQPAPDHAFGLVRQVCVALLESREEMSPFIDGDFDEYVKAMANVQTWGGEPELAIAAEVLQLPVTVYQQKQACRPAPL